MKKKFIFFFNKIPSFWVASCDPMDSFNTPRLAHLSAHIICFVLNEFKARTHPKELCSFEERRRTSNHLCTNTYRNSSTIPFFTDNVCNFRPGDEPRVCVLFRGQMARANLPSGLMNQLCFSAY